MANSVQVTLPTSNKDVYGAQFVCDFESFANSSYIPPARYTQRVVLVAGQQMSYAVVVIPADTFGDETGPTCALLSTGPAGKVKLRSRASVGFRNRSGNKVSMLNGTLVTYGHSIVNDGLVASVFDDKLLLAKITVFGRFCYDPEAGVFSFDAGSKCIFNEFGQPNCIDSPLGPVFAPSARFGYKASFSAEDLNEPAVGQALTRARSWQFSDSDAYLRRLHSAEMAGTTPVVVDYGSRRLKKNVQWPATACQVVGATRTLKNVDVDNKTLLEALSILCRKAGAYDLYFSPVGAYDSVLSYVNMNPADKQGGQLYLPKGYVTDAGAAMVGPDVVLGGVLNESIVNYFDDTCICGDPAAVERFLANSVVGAGSVFGIERPWSQTDEDAFKAYMDDASVLGTPVSSAERFDIACKLWPLVFASARIKTGFDLWEGTKYAGYFNQKRNPRLHPELLSADNQSSLNPRNWDKKPIVIECDSDNTGNWQACERLDGLQISADGQYLIFPALRRLTTMANGAAVTQGTMTIFNTDSSNPYKGSTMQWRPMRFTMVGEGDWRITGRAGHDDNNPDPNSTQHRIRTKDDDKWTYLTVAADGDYVDHNRRLSNPNGYATIDAAHRDFADKCAVGHELFTDLNLDGVAASGRLPRHAQTRNADVKRIEYTGVLIQPGLVPSARPGNNVVVESMASLGTYSVLKCVVFEADSQNTQLELGSHDMATIYDIPMTRSTSGQGGKSSGYPETTATGGQRDGKGGTADDYDEGGDEFRVGPRGADMDESAVDIVTALAKSAPERKRGSIRSGAELESADRVASNFGNHDAGIFTGNDIKQSDMDLKARGVGRGKANTEDEVGLSYRDDVGVEHSVDPISERRRGIGRGR